MSESFQVNEYGVLTGNYVNFRSNPSISSKSKGLLLQGVDLKIVMRTDKKENIGGKTDYWYKCWIGENYDGWIFGSYIKKSSGKNMKPNYKKDFDVLKLYSSDFYPSGFDIISKSKWIDMKPEVVKNNIDAQPDSISINKNILYDTYNYIDQPVYQIVDIEKESENKFVLSLKLIAIMYPLKSINDIYKKAVIVFNKNDNTLTVTIFGNKARTFYKFDD